MNAAGAPRPYHGSAASRGGQNIELPAPEAICQAVIDAACTARLEECNGAVSSSKDDGSAITCIDLRVQEALASTLGRRWPDFAFLGEEMAHDQQAEILHSECPGVWCLDPLDGTTNFARGFPFYGVSLALIVERQPRLGVVYDPVRRECFWAREGAGAWLNGVRLRAPGGWNSLTECIANVDYKRLVAVLAERLVRSPPYGSQRNVGSSVLEWCWLAAGRFQLYLHGGQKLWDFAAGNLILTEAGGCARSIDGAHLDGRSLAKRSVVAAVTPALFDEWFAWISDTLGRQRPYRRSGAGAALIDTAE